MSRPSLFLRPATQGFVVTLMVALTGCGVPSSQDVTPPADTGPISRLEADTVQGALSKPMPMSAPMPAPWRCRNRR